MEIEYGNSQREAILDMSKNPHSLRRVAPLLYNESLSKYPRGLNMSNLENALRELREKRQRAQVEIEKIDQIISGIESLNGSSAVSANTAQPKRVISDASRRKMVLAQRARWTAIKKASQPAVVTKTTSVAPKRTMSAASRKKIAAAVRARWAKIRAEKKAA